MMCNKSNDKIIISCLGDSLTEGDYGVKGKSGIANIHDENYPYFLSQITGLTVRNFGKCGFTSSSYKKHYDDGNVDIRDSDIIIIMLGTNGGLDLNPETKGNLDYKYIVDRCRTDAPNAEIILCTPPHATENPEYSNFGYADRVKNAVLFVRKFAKENGIKLIDVAKCPYFTVATENIMQPNDGLHFGRFGYEKLAEYIASFLKNNNLI